MFFPGEERLEANVLAMRIQPDEGISLRFGAKMPGPTMELQEVDMNFQYGSSFCETVTQADAYERLLLDAMLGDRTLFTRADEVEQAWAWAEDIQAGWRRSTRTTCTSIRRARGAQPGPTPSSSATAGSGESSSPRAKRLGLWRRG